MKSFITLSFVLKFMKIGWFKCTLTSSVNVIEFRFLELTSDAKRIAKEVTLETGIQQKFTHIRILHTTWRRFVNTLNFVLKLMIIKHLNQQFDGNDEVYGKLQSVKWFETAIQIFI